MPKEKRLIQKEDIMPLDVYTIQRKDLRKKIVDYKKNRRIQFQKHIATCKEVCLEKIKMKSSEKDLTLRDRSLKMLLAIIIVLMQKLLG